MPMAQMIVNQTIKKIKTPDFFPGLEFLSRNGPILAVNFRFELLLTGFPQITERKQRFGRYRRPID